MGRAIPSPSRQHEPRDERALHASGPPRAPQPVGARALPRRELHASRSVGELLRHLGRARRRPRARGRALMLATALEVLANGKRLRTARLGSGAPLVLLHGYPDNLQLFSRLAPALAAGCDVRAFDWPGMGASDEWPGGA